MTTDLPLPRKRAPMYPRIVEQALARDARRLVRAHHRAMARTILAVGDVRVHVRRSDQRTVQNPTGVIIALGQHTEVAADARAMIGRYGKRVQRHVDGELAEVLQRPTLLRVGQDIGEDTYAGWADEAASRIRVILDEDRAGVAQLVTRGHLEGWSTRRLGREIAQLQVTSERRARVWARDQIGTVNALANQSRQIQLGVVSYLWRTSRDERVRSLHASREGQEFQWSERPSAETIDGHPGEPINCRCTPEPVLPDFGAP